MSGPRSGGRRFERLDAEAQSTAEANRPVAEVQPLSAFELSMVLSEVRGRRWTSSLINDVEKVLLRARSGEANGGVIRSLASLRDCILVMLALSPAGSSTTEEPSPALLRALDRGVGGPFSDGEPASPQSEEQPAAIAAILELTREAVVALERAELSVAGGSVWADTAGRAERHGYPPALPHVARRYGAGAPQGLELLRFATWVEHVSRRTSDSDASDAAGLALATTEQLLHAVLAMRMLELALVCVLAARGIWSRDVVTSEQGIALSGVEVTRARKMAMGWLPILFGGTSKTGGTGKLNLTDIVRSVAILDDTIVDDIYQEFGAVYALLLRVPNGQQGQTPKPGNASIPWYDRFQQPSSTTRNKRKHTHETMVIDAIIRIRNAGIYAHGWDFPSVAEVRFVTDVSWRVASVVYRYAYSTASQPNPNSTRTGTAPEASPAQVDLRTHARLLVDILADAETGIERATRELERLRDGMTATY